LKDSQGRKGTVQSQPLDQFLRLGLNLNPCELESICSRTDQDQRPRFHLPEPVCRFDHDRPITNLWLRSGGTKGYVIASSRQSTRRSTAMGCLLHLTPNNGDTRPLPGGAHGRRSAPPRPKPQPERYRAQQKTNAQANSLGAGLP
jgi:hypothetical protein